MLAGEYCEITAEDEAYGYGYREEYKAGAAEDFGCE